MGRQYHTPLHKAQKLLRKRGEKDYVLREENTTTDQCFRDTKGELLHLWTPSSCDSVDKACTSFSQTKIPAWRRGEGHRFPPLFSSRVCPPPGLGDHTPIQVSHPRVHGLHKLNLMGLKKQKRRTGSYVGRDVGWFWEELGGRGSYDKNIPYKIFKGLRIFKKIISESVANDWGRGWPLGQQCWPLHFPKSLICLRHGKFQILLPPA